MEILRSVSDTAALQRAVAAYHAADYPVALTGAGISVASGIPDFRSRGGLWTVFSPEEYATLDVFLTNPEKAWELYRALGKTIMGKVPNSAHYALAQLEQQGRLKAIITQNVDQLHQQAGSESVVEVHGDHQHLHCLQCRYREPVTASHYHGDNVPCCRKCGFPLKPCVVLFGEGVQNYQTIQELIPRVDLLLVIGTSAQVYPAADIPYQVKRNHGLVYEFNYDNVLGSGTLMGADSLVDYCFQGNLSETLPWFVHILSAPV